MLVDACFPEDRTRIGVERVGGGLRVAEIDRIVPAGGGCHVDSGAHGLRSFEAPVGAAGVRIESVDRAAGAAYEQTSAGDGRLTERGRCARETERPLQLQLPDVAALETRGRCALRASIFGIGAPSAPAVRVFERRGGRRAAAPAGFF